MLLLSSDDRSFSLQVDKYEFPDEETCPTADNPVEDFDRGRFLIVTVELRTPDGHWQATAPEMTTTELERLASWLEAVSKVRPPQLSVYFTERDLEFSTDEDLTAVNVHLFRDFLPPWTKGECFTITFPRAEIDLGRAAASIRSQLDQFPHLPVPDQSA